MSALTGTKISYEFLSNTLQSLFGPKKNPLFRGAMLIYAALTRAHMLYDMQAGDEAKAASAPSSSAILLKHKSK